MIIYFAFFIASCNNSNNSANDKQKIATVKKETTKVVLTEEFPEAKTCKSNLGVLRTDVNGHTVGKKTEMTELRRLLKNKDCDIIEISYELASNKYDNVSKKIVYNRRDCRLMDIYTKNNVIEDYSGVDENGLLKFLDKGKNSFYYLSEFTNSKYDFNNREMEQKTIGNQPSQSELDGSVRVVENYVKSISKDTSSIRFIEWSKVSPFDEFWIVRCKYKSIKSEASENKWFYIQNDKVVKTKDIKE